MFMKVRIVICVIAALFVFCGASPWEGAAAIAPEGELPVTGRYIATNSFPRNTIVDITNIETGRSTRVIVSNSLNSPGLLAIVSRDAAELIGMRPGSVSRIRMVQPSDPIAYLRFTEGVNADIPEYDSGNVITENVITEENLPDERYRDDTYTPSVAENSENAPQGTPVDRIMGPSYVLEPEWEGQGRNIIDLPGYIKYPDPEQPRAEPVTGAAEETPRVVRESPEQRVVEETPRVVERSQNEIIKDVAEKIDETPNGEVLKDVPEYVAEAVREEAEKDVPVYTSEEPPVKAEARPPEEEVSRNESVSEQPREEAVKDISEYIAETVREEAEKDIPEKTQEAPREEIAKDIPERTEESVQVTEARPPEERTEYNLVPAPDCPPPNTIYGMDPSDIIPEVAAAPPVREPARPAPPVAAPTVTPVAPAAPPAATSSIPPLSLDRGWYYVQIASVDSLESVENIVRQIDSRYEPKAYRDSNNRLCILLKPMNQGESAAVLQRFKSIGFKDAFVRRGG